MNRLFVVTALFVLHMRNGAKGDKGPPIGPPFPAIVEVVFQSEEHSKPEPLCDGTIVSRTLILTSASCLEYNVGQVLVMTSNPRGNIFKKVKGWYVPPEYAEGCGFQDVAFIELEKPLEWNRRTRFVNLKTKNSLIPNKTKIASPWHWDLRNVSTVGFWSGLVISNEECGKKLSRSIESLRGRLCVQADGAFNLANKTGYRQLTGGAALFEYEDEVENEDEWVQAGVMISMEFRNKSAPIAIYTHVSAEVVNSIKKEKYKFRTPMPVSRAGAKGLKGKGSTASYPTIVKVVFHYQDTLVPLFECDGTILSKNFVLTSTDCVIPDKKRMSIIIGHNKNKIVKKMANWFNISSHDEEGELVAHISVIKLDSPLTLNKTTRPVNLGSGNMKIVTNSRIISPWHSDKGDRKEVEFWSGSMISNEECGKMLKRTKESLKGKFCVQLDDSEDDSVDAAKLAGYTQWEGSPALYENRNKQDDEDVWVQAGVMVSISSSSLKKPIAVYKSIPLDIYNWLHAIKFLPRHETSAVDEECGGMDLIDNTPPTVTSAWMALDGLLKE